MSEAAVEAPILLRTVNLHKTYTDGQVQAVAGVSFTVRRGEYVAIMGPSGCGKSTLLNLLGGLDLPDEGQVLFEEQSIATMPNPDRFRATKIGYVFQSFLLIPTLKAVENVQVPMFGGPLSSHQRTAKARELLEEVGLGHRMNHLPMKLSVGERQRVAIARRSRTMHRFCWPTNPPGISTRKRRARSSTFSIGSRLIVASRSWSSPTANRSHVAREGSWSCLTARFCASLDSYRPPSFSIVGSGCQR